MYDKEYLEYDKYGLKKVGCMRCNIPIKKRKVVKEEKGSGEIINVYAIQTLKAFTPVPYDINTGSYTNILMCDECARGHSNTEEERKGMALQLKRGWVGEVVNSKRSQKEIDFIKKTVEALMVIRPTVFSKKK